MSARRHVYYANEKGRDFVVGDLHGMFDRFWYELDLIDFDVYKDRMFCVGDLIDRGPDSDKCLALTQHDWFHSVYGNHEDLMVKSELLGDHYYKQMWWQNGGWWSEDCSDEKLSEYLKFVLELPHFITLYHKSGKSVGICHAQAPTLDWHDIGTLSKEELKTALWGRRVANGKVPEDYRVKNVSLTVHGHTPMHDVLRVGNSLFIDTGACFGDGTMTIINLDTYLQEEL